MYGEDEFLALSGIQHFSFCRRQWALIYLECVWEDNLLTAQGTVMHRRAHDASACERRAGSLIIRGLAVHSRRLGLSGACDVVELRRDSEGHPLYGEDGLWRALPVEYKRGRPKLCDADRLQVCAQGMCLEEMLGGDVPEGCLYYGETRRREKVLFDDALRQEVKRISEEMHDLFRRRVTPKVKPFAACKSCSLADECMPRMLKRPSASSYLRKHIEGAT